MQAVGFGVRSTTNEAAVTEWIIEGQFDHPVRVIAFNSGEGWSRDVTEDVAPASSLPASPHDAVREWIREVPRAGAARSGRFVSSSVPWRRRI